MQRDSQLDSLEALLADSERLRRVALRATRGDAFSADDLVQETWLSYLQSPPAHRGREQGWLIRVLRNHAHRAARDRIRRVRRETACARPEAQEETPLRVLGLRADKAAVERGLASLPPQGREALQLRYLDGLAPRQVAALLDLPVETVRTRVRRAAARMCTAMHTERRASESA